MLATLTTKGQITLPKAIRDKLGLDAGSQINFELLADDTIQARVLRPDARNVRGILRSPLAAAPSIEAIDDAIASHLAGKHVRPALSSSASKPRKASSGRR